MGKHPLNRPNPDWENLDWNRTNQELAADLGFHANYIGKKRHELAPATVRDVGMWGKPRPPSPWDNVDWEQSDAQIARQLRVSEREARLQRLVDTDPKRGPCDWSQVDWSLTDDQIVALTRRSLSTVMWKRRKKKR